MENEVDLTIPPGLHLSGVVVDENEIPVPGAGVWISVLQPRGGLLPQSNRHIDDGFAAVTAPDGTFEIPSTGEARCVGARTHLFPIRKLRI